MDIESIQQTQRLLSKVVENTIAQAKIIADTADLLDDYADYIKSEIERLQNAG